MPQTKSSGRRKNICKYVRHIINIINVYYGQVSKRQLCKFSPLLHKPLGYGQLCKFSPLFHKPLDIVNYPSHISTVTTA